MILKKHFFYFLFCCLMACSANTSPDLAAMIAGQYRLEYLNLAGDEITPEYLKMVGGITNISAEKKDQNTIIIYIKSTKPQNTEVSKTFSLSEGSNGIINILENGQRVGSFNNGKIDLSSNYTNGVLGLKAQKI